MSNWIEVKNTYINIDELSAFAFRKFKAKDNQWVMLFELKTGMEVETLPFTDEEKKRIEIEIVVGSSICPNSLLKELAVIYEKKVYPMKFSPAKKGLPDY